VITRPQLITPSQLSSDTAPKIRVRSDGRSSGPVSHTLRAAITSNSTVLMPASSISESFVRKAS